MHECHRLDKYVFVSVFIVLASESHQHRASNALQRGSPEQIAGGIMRKAFLAEIRLINMFDIPPEGREGLWRRGHNLSFALTLSIPTWCNAWCTQRTT
jgi:hypothetical protein